MLPRLFTDPLGNELPALERSILLLRGIQMLLVMFYAEELKLVNVFKPTTDTAKYAARIYADVLS